ncbi:MAG: hypothetical protein U5K31_07875 [Balneolaceae bacterium]|nr:hypothetical protein [Balneolaceae bacterium]
MTRISIATLLLVLLACTAREASAQQSGDQSGTPIFGSLRLEADLGRSIGQNIYTRNWLPQTVGGLTLATPFHLGELEVGLRYSRFLHDEMLNGFSDFHAVYAWLGWNLPLELGEKTTVLTGLSLGNTYFSYDQARIYTAPGADWSYAFDRSESEISYELSLELHYGLGEGWGLFGGVAYNRTLTYHPLELTLLRAGISRTFDSPSWLQSFLR